MNAIAVRVIADDQDTRDDTVARLQRCPRLRVVTDDADAVLVVTDEVSVFTLRAVRAATDRGCAPRPGVVVMCNRIQRQELLHAARLGLVSVLSRSIDDLDRLWDALVQAANRPATAPEESRPAKLSTREIQVLRLLADGHDTSAIAVRLRYSERTVKYIIHDVVTRERLRNRAHAVAFALRQGVL